MYGIIIYSAGHSLATIELIFMKFETLDIL